MPGILERLMAALVARYAVERELGRVARATVFPPPDHRHQPHGRAPHARETPTRLEGGR